MSRRQSSSGNSGYQDPRHGLLPPRNDAPVHGISDIITQGEVLEYVQTLDHEDSEAIWSMLAQWALQSGPSQGPDQNYAEFFEYLSARGAGNYYSRFCDWRTMNRLSDRHDPPGRRRGTSYGLEDTRAYGNREWIEEPHYCECEDETSFNSAGNHDYAPRRFGSTRHPDRGTYGMDDYDNMGYPDRGSYPASSTSGRRRAGHGQGMSGYNNMGYHDRDSYPAGSTSGRSRTGHSHSMADHDNMGYQDDRPPHSGSSTSGRSRTQGSRRRGPSRQDQTHGSFLDRIDEFP